MDREARGFFSRDSGTPSRLANPMSSSISGHRTARPKSVISQFDRCAVVAPWRRGKSAIVFDGSVSRLPNPSDGLGVRTQDKRETIASALARRPTLAYSGMASRA